jgi:hypothetical protein
MRRGERKAQRRETFRFNILVSTDAGASEDAQFLLPQHVGEPGEKGRHEMTAGFEFCKTCFGTMKRTPARKAGRGNPVKKYYCRTCREYRFLDIARNYWVSLRHQCAINPTENVDSEATVRVFYQLG